MVVVFGGIKLEGFKVKLSDIQCKNAKYDPNEKPNGKKHKLISFGVYPEVSLKEARLKRDDTRKVLAEGQDPSAVKQEEKQQAIAKTENTFEAIAKEWHSHSIILMTVLVLYLLAPILKRGHKGFHGFSYRSH